LSRLGRRWRDSLNLFVPRTVECLAECEVLSHGGRWALGTDSSVQGVLCHRA
jgi:hypothetical protein